MYKIDRRGGGGGGSKNCILGNYHLMRITTNQSQAPRAYPIAAALGSEIIKIINILHWSRKKLIGGGRVQKSFSKKLISFLHLYDVF